VISSDFNPISQWVAERAGCSIPNMGSAIGQFSGEDIVAGVMYENFTGASVTATIAVEPGTILNKDFMRLIFEYPFKQLGVKKMFAIVSDANEKSINFVTRCGFIEETRVKDYYESGDAIVFACTPESCRWLMLH
jgi:hypothetical protein